MVLSSTFDQSYGRKDVTKNKLWQNKIYIVLKLLRKIKNSLKSVVRKFLLYLISITHQTFRLTILIVFNTLSVLLDELVTI